MSTEARTEEMEDPGLFCNEAGNTGRRMHVSTRSTEFRLSIVTWYDIRYL